VRRRYLQSVGCDVGASVGDGDGLDVGPKTKQYSIYENELYFYDIRVPNKRDSTNIPLVGEAVGFAFGLRVNVGETEGMMLKK